MGDPKTIAFFPAVMSTATIRAKYVFVEVHANLVFCTGRKTTNRIKFPARQTWLELNVFRSQNTVRNGTQDTASAQSSFCRINAHMLCRPVDGFYQGVERNRHIVAPFCD